jgi:hypothetical protein
MRRFRFFFCFLALIFLMAEIREWRIVPMTIADGQANQTSPVSAEQNGLEADEIRRQEATARALGAEARWANRLNIVLLVAAGLLAVFIALNSQWVSRANSRLREAENRLNELKVAGVRADAEHKIEIDREKVRAVAATDLQVKTEAVKQEAKTEQKRIDAVTQKQIARLTARAEQAKQGIANATAKAALAREKAEAERLERLKLHEAVAPRSLGDQGSLIGRLQTYPGLNVIIESLADPEASRLAQQLASVLNTAGWRITKISRTLDDTKFRDGVVVEASFGYQNEKGEWEKDDRMVPAAEALVAELNVRGVRSSRLPGVDLPPRTIRIRVGLKPMTYFLPEDIKRCLKEIEKGLKAKQAAPQ